MSHRARFGLGIAIAVIAAALIVADVLSPGWGSALGVVGIGLIASAASGRSEAA